MTTNNNNHNLNAISPEVGPQPDHSSYLFRDPIFINQIGGRFPNPQVAIDYIRHSGPTYFHDPGSVDDQVLMQSRYNQFSPNQLDRSKLSGSTLRVAWCDPINQIFHIAKDWQHGYDNKFTPMAIYSISKDTAQQAPSIYAMLTARLNSGLNHLRTAYNNLNNIVKFTPAQGYQWQIPKSNQLSTTSNPITTDMVSDIEPSRTDNQSILSLSQRGGTNDLITTNTTSITGDNTNKLLNSKSNETIPINPLHALKSQVFGAQIHAALMRAAARENIQLPDIPIDNTTTTDNNNNNTGEMSDNLTRELILPTSSRKKKTRRERDRDSDAGSLMGESSGTTTTTTTTTPTTTTRKKRKKASNNNNNNMDGRKSRASTVELITTHQ